uniref:Uncharacterized protein n=1 Tax=candidate division WOR-3 bacterium TaxID=2052148 RepID=A0A7C4UAW0_UNCW3
MIFLLLSLKIYFFFSPDCPDCSFVKDKIIKKLEGRYEIIYLSVEIPENMRLLMEIEDRKKDYNNKIPVVYVGDSLFGSKEEIMEGLLNYLKVVGKDNELKTEELSVYRLKNPVKLLYFYKKGCRVCERMEYELRLLNKEFEGLIIEEYDIEKSLFFLYNIEKRLGLRRDRFLLTPVVVLNDEVFFQGEINKLKEKILKVQEEGNEGYYERFKKGDKFEILSLLKIGSIFFAGIIDGINPCAFGTLIFLITLFSISGGRKEITLSGIGFIISVFITYFLIGMGLFNMLRGLSIFLTISRIIYIFSGILAFVFGFLSIYDIFRIKMNKEMIIKMPDFLKRLSRRSARNIYTSSIIFFSSLIIGFIVTLFEFTCTGQIYFPVIASIAQDPVLRFNGLKPLFIYNSGFIIPIFVLFLFYLFGIKEIELSSFLKRRLITIKSLTAIILFIFGIYIIISIK